MHTFSTSDADRLPLLHVILKESFEQSDSGNLAIKHPISMLLNFLCGIHFLDEVCTRTSSKNLRAGEEFSEQAFTVLTAASKSDDYANVVNAMLEAGAYVDRGDQDLMTPLHHAAMCGCTEVIKIILKHKASVQCQK